MTTFALVHGAWHGAWCWQRLIPELERRRHGTVAVDLACEDPAATFADYAETVVSALDGAGAGEDVVAVRDPLGGTGGVAGRDGGRRRVAAELGLVHDGEHPSPAGPGPHVMIPSRSCSGRHHSAASTSTRPATLPTRSRSATDRSSIA